MPADRGYDDPTRPLRALTPAHVPMLVLTVFLVIALVLGIAGGEIGAKTFRQPVPSPSDPITIP